MYRKLYPAAKFPDGHTDLAVSLNNVGIVLESLGRLESALEHYQQALAMRRKLYPAAKFPDGHADLAGSLNNMGVVLESLGRLEAALEHHQQALAMNRKLYPGHQVPRRPHRPGPQPEQRGECAAVSGPAGVGPGALPAGAGHAPKLFPAAKFPDGHTHLASSLNNVGSVLKSLGRLEA